MRLLALLALLGSLQPATFTAPVGTAFSYQGRLREGGTAVTGTYDFEFKLFDAATDGNQIGATLAVNDVTVANGLFTVLLDFGASAFPGDDRWLETAVRRGAETGAYDVLTPRRLLAAVPYAMQAASATSADNAAAAATLSGTLPATQLTGTVPLAQLPAAVVTNNAAGVALAGAFTGNAAGLTNLNLNRSDGSSLTVGQAWGDGPFQVYGSTWVLDQHNDNFGYYFTRGGAWQSFTCAANGTLAAIKAWVYSYAGGPWSGTLNLYAGEGTAGALLASQPVSGDGVMQERTFALETPVALTLGSRYTFAFRNASATLRLRGSSDAYAGGICDYSASYDYHFSTWMEDTAAAPALVVQPNTLNVGIGKANPASALDVNGTVTATAFVGDGSGLTSLDATSLTGTVADARLSANVALLNANQAFTGSNRFAGVVAATNVANTFAGSFTGDGAGLAGVLGAMPWQTVPGTTQTATANTGYVLTNAATTTVTLPASANVGDVVRISGAGAGGWEVSGSIVGASVGAVWKQHVGVRGDWSCVASSADGAKLAAGLFGQLICTSSDSGATWLLRATPQNWIGIASSADGIRLAAVTYPGQIYMSTDSGETWTARATTQTWSGVASSSDGAKLVATVANGQIYTSSDSGTNWTARASSRAWRAVASSSDGTKLVAAVVNGQLYTSNDSGANWTPRESNRYWYSVASSADGVRLLAAEGNGQLYTSTDSGTNWTSRGDSRAWISVASSADGTRLVAAVLGGQIYHSMDAGVTWTPRAINLDWMSVASSAHGDKLAAVPKWYDIYTSAVGGGAGETATLQYFGNGQWQILAESEIAAGAVGSQQLASDLTLAGTMTAAAFVGSGAGVTNLDAAQLSTGVMPDARLSANVALLDAAQTFTGANSFTKAVGIGTSTPACALEVNAAGHAQIGIKSTDSFGHLWTLQSTGGSMLMSLPGDWGAFQIWDRTAGSSRLMITAAGNVGLGITPSHAFDLAGGAYCTGTQWQNASDRDAKERFTAIEPAEVLAKVTTLPITEWKYKSEPDGIKHLGPVAQDFHAAFGLGDDDKAIGTVDEAGVALAAIQGLNQKLEEKNAALEKELAELKAIVKALAGKLRGGAQ